MQPIHVTALLTMALIMGLFFVMFAVLTEPGEAVAVRPGGAPPPGLYDR